MSCSRNRCDFDRECNNFEFESSNGREFNNTTSLESMCGSSCNSGCGVNENWRSSCNDRRARFICTCRRICD